MYIYIDLEYSLRRPKLTILKRIIIHAGMPKTGTTSIQKTLYHNCGLLQEGNFLYIKEWGSLHNDVIREMFFEKYNPNNPAHIVNSMSEDDWRRYNKKNTEIMLHAIETSSCENLILSAEGLFSRKEYYLEYMKETLNNLFPGVEQSVILFVRNPVRYLTSLFQERIKDGRVSILLPHEIYPDAQDVYKTGISQLAKIFDGNISVVSFEDAIQEQDLTCSFLKHVGFPLNLLPRIKSYQANESTSKEAIEFLQYIKKNEPMLIPSNDKLILNPSRTPNDTNAIVRITGQKFDLPYEVKENFFTLSYSNAVWLNENYGIDYTKKEFKESASEPLYSDDTLTRFITSFPLLSRTLQRIFLKFFEQKYSETQDDRFLDLFVRGSQPWRMHQIKYDESRIRKIATASERIAGWNVIRSPHENSLFLSFKAHDGLRLISKQELTHDQTPCKYFEFVEKIESEDAFSELCISPGVFPCIASIDYLTINGRTDLIPSVEGNYDEVFDSTFSFYCDNPFLIYKYDEPIRTIELGITIDSNSLTFSLLNTAWISELLVKHEKKLNDLEKDFISLENKYNKVVTSRSWKLTKPLRALRKRLKRTKRKI